jgi:surface antigen
VEYQEPSSDEVQSESDQGDPGWVGPATLTGLGTGAAGLGTAAAAGAVAGLPGGPLGALLGGAIGAASGGVLGALTDQAMAPSERADAAEGAEHDTEPPPSVTDDRVSDR